MVSPIKSCSDGTLADSEERIHKGPSNGKNSLKEDKNVWKKNVQQVHTGRVNNIFSPMRLILLVVGRFPFIPTKSDAESGGNYIVSLKSPFWAFFFVTSGLIIVAFILITGGFLDVFLGWSFIAIQHWGIHHKSIFHSNLIPFVLVWSCLLHSCVGSISFILNRKTVVKFLNFWNVAVDKLNSDVPQSLRKFVIMSNLWFFFFLVITMVSYKIL
jgi:hypothetical protein